MLDRFDAAQRAVVLHDGPGLLIVPSGAGTGKTTVLTHRIRHLAERGVPADNILALTFTRDAVAEMRHRLTDFGAGCDGVRVKTLHAYAAGLLRAHGAHLGLAGGAWTIASGAEANEVLVAAILASGMTPDAAEENERVIDVARRRVGRWKENGLRVEHLDAPDRPPLDDDVLPYLDVYRAYQAGLAQRGVLDFGDMTMAAVKLLAEHPEVAAGETGRNRVLLVDEAQDMNLLQVELVRLLSADAAVTVVGDDDQALYGFRGSVPLLMERLPALLPAVAARGVTTINLTVNRRCTEECLVPANLLVNRNRRAAPKVLTSGRHGQDLLVRGFASDRMEAQAVADRISVLQGEGVPLSEIAVLARARRVLEALEVVLHKRRIPCVIQGGTGFSERPEVADVLAYLQLATSPRAASAFARIVSRPARGLGAVALEAVLQLAQNSGISIHQALLRAVDAGAIRGPALQAQARECAAQLAALEHAAASDAAPDRVVDYVLNTVGYRDWAAARKDAPRTLTHSLASLRELSVDAGSLEDYVAEIIGMGDPQVRLDGMVTLSTLHSSKGREWGHVLIMACERGVLPHPRSLMGKALSDNPWEADAHGGIEEERRLLHVGLTRAKTTVALTFAMSRGHADHKKTAGASSLLREAGIRVPEVRQGLAVVRARPSPTRR